jgi:hypothetical protein
MQDLKGLDIDFTFDGDTQEIDGNPVIVFGESYSGAVLLRNSNHYQYVILGLTPDDPDMKVQALDDKYVMPGETRLLKFTIETSKARKKPFKCGVAISGGFVM